MFNTCLLIIVLISALGLVLFLIVHAIYALIARHKLRQLTKEIVKYQQSITDPSKPSTLDLSTIPINPLDLAYMQKQVAKNRERVVEQRKEQQMHGSEILRKALEKIQTRSSAQARGYLKAHSRTLLPNLTDGEREELIAKVLEPMP